MKGQMIVIENIRACHEPLLFLSAAAASSAPLR